MSQCTLTLFHHISSLDCYIPLAQINIEHELVCLSLTAFQISRGRQFPHHVRFENEPPSVSSTTNEGFPNPSWLCTFLRKRPSYPSSSMTSTRAMYNSLGLQAFLLSTLVITKSPSTISSSDDWSESSSTNFCQSSRSEDESDDSTGTSSARRLRDVATREKRLRFGCVTSGASCLQRVITYTY